MPTQYVTFSVNVTARVDADESREGLLTISEVSAVFVEGVNISLETVPSDLYGLIDEIAAETALTNGDWND